MTRTEEHLIEIQSSLRKWNTFSSVVYSKRI